MGLRGIFLKNMKNYLIIQGMGGGGCYLLIFVVMCKCQYIIVQKMENKNAQ